jgi:hypothetical protein
MRLAPRAALGLALVACLGGCPLQTPTFQPVPPALRVSASLAAPLVGDTITLTVKSPTGGDVAGARWTTTDGTVVALSQASGTTVTATAVKLGVASLGVSAGGLRGSVTITVLQSVGQIDLMGPTALVVGATGTYAATKVTDPGGRALSTTLTWEASGSVAFATPDVNSGASMTVRAIGVGPGTVKAMAGGEMAQIDVMVSAESGQLVIARADGTPVGTLGSGDALALEASYSTSKQLADDAQWTWTGACKLLGGSGATVSVQAAGNGSCTVTAVAMGMSAAVTFPVASVTGVKITGMTGPLGLGETRTLTATGLAGMDVLAPVAVTWATSNTQVLSIEPAGTTVKVTALAVGDATLTADLGKTAMDSIDLTVLASAIKIAAPSSQIFEGSSTTVTATPFGPTGTAGRFATTAGLAISGATGFTTVGPPILTPDGTVTFGLAGANADSPTVTVSLGAIVSNTLAFSVAKIASVTIVGPQGPVRVGSTVDLTAAPLDASGKVIAGDVATTWTDGNGVYQFPAGATLHVTATAAKLGTASIVATIMGISSAPFASPVQPAMVAITAFTPGTIALPGGAATTVVTILDSSGNVVPNVPLSQVSLAADDPTKASFVGAVMGSGFQFTATPLLAGHIAVTATWTDGMFPVQSNAVPLTITGP